MAAVQVLSRSLYSQIQFDFPGIPSPGIADFRGIILDRSQPCDANQAPSAAVRLADASVAASLSTIAGGTKTIEIDYS
jgi:hypothetical protein